ncbi:hypothetical protein [Salinispira pacifica]|uniref:hypothetical protein n=1 Tax=Salinispira pacifica TaxID=1307761 RepID=UPI00059D3B19|nr:hypothetical protein [Salinispira pacifica]
MTEWHGLGGLLLLFITAGLPLGAVLLVKGSALLAFRRNVIHGLLLLFLLEIGYFLFHAVRLLQDWSVPFVFFAVSGYLYITIFIILVLAWMRTRKTLAGNVREVSDYILCGGISFLSAAWQTCGMVGAPGFALQPEIALELGNRSFILGQILIMQFFLLMGFVFLLAAMRRLKFRNGKADSKNRQVPLRH